MSLLTPSPLAIDRDWTRVADRGRHDPLFHNKYILGYDKLIGRIHGEQLRILQLHDKVAFIEPREHFKTTNVTEGYVTWRIEKNPNIRILIIHRPYKEARTYLQVVRDHLEHNPILRKCYGDFVRKKGRWGDDAITVGKRTKIFHEPTLTVASPDHDPVGGHFNIIILDDIVGLKDRYSPATRASTQRYIRALWAMLLEGGQFIDIGTRWHTHDAHATEILGLPQERIPRREDFFVRVRSAVQQDGSLYFPEQFSHERLSALKLGMGPALYSSQMLNVPIAEGMRRFNVDDFHYYEPDRLPAAGKRAAYIDPATGESIDKGDYTAMIVGILTGNQVYVPHAILRNEPFERFVPSMLAALKEYHVQTLYVEANAFQTFFAKAVLQAIRKAGLSTRVHKVKQYRNKIERIDAIEPLLTGGQVLLRTDWDRVYPLLLAQLGDFPNGEHDDGPDCLEGLLRALLRVKGALRRVILPPPPKR